MNIVLDASVVLKWLLLGVQHEDEQDDAVTICEYAFTGKVTLCQPVHWLAEVGAGMAPACTGYGCLYHRAPRPAACSDDRASHDLALGNDPFS